MAKLSNTEKFNSLKLLYKLKCEYHKREISTIVSNAKSSLNPKGYLGDILTIGTAAYSIYNKINSGKK